MENYEFLDLSGLTYYDGRIKRYIDEKVSLAFNVELVEELPESGDPKTIYLVPDTAATQENVYDEYMYIDDEWECIGTTMLDLETKQDKLTIGENIEIDEDDDNRISALGYHWDEGTGGFAEKFINSDGEVVDNIATGTGSHAEGGTYETLINEGATVVIRRLTGDERWVLHETLHETKDHYYSFVIENIESDDLLMPGAAFYRDSSMTGSPLTFLLESVRASIDVYGSYTLSGIFFNLVDNWAYDIQAGETASTYYHFDEKDFGATADYSHVAGFGCLSDGLYAHSDSFLTRSIGVGTHAEGIQAEASGIGAHAEGGITYARGTYSHAEGKGTQANSGFSHTEGAFTNANGEAAHAEGHESTASEYAAHAEGLRTIASGIGSHSEGMASYINSITASGDGAHAGGLTNSGGTIEALGDASFANGFAELGGPGDNPGIISASSAGTFVNGYVSGGKLSAKGEGAHAEGAAGDYGAISAAGEGSYAGGSIMRSSISSEGSGSFAHGSGSGKITAYGSGAHAEGYSSYRSEGIIASGNGSYAIGYLAGSGSQIIASGNGSFAAGYAESNGIITAAGDGSHAEGCGTTALNYSEHAEGSFNTSHQVTEIYGNSGNTQHSIGIGSDMHNTKNAIEVMQDGSIYVYNIGGYNGTDTKAQNPDIKTLQEVVESGQFSPEPLCFTAQQVNSSIGITNNGGNTPNIEYSIDNGNTWNTWDYNTITLSSVGDKVLMRGINQGGFSTSSSKYSTFTMSGLVAASGNIMSLIDYTQEVTIIPCGYCYCQMFYGCTSLTTAPELPATTLTSYCYSSMFSNCTSLTTAPVLPATTLADWCYGYMFYGCTNLTTAPELPATSLAGYCYNGMFNSCTRLTTAPTLPATKLATFCYSYIFYGCTSLTTAPELPATTLASECYSSMFSNCTSLTNAPELPATTLANNCYSGMFYNCINLNYIKCLAVNGINQNSSTAGWVDSVASSGEFVKESTATGWTLDSNSGIPSGWTIYSHYNDVELDKELTGGTVPIGSITMWAGETAPDGWLLCSGETIAVTEVPHGMEDFTVTITVASTQVSKDVQVTDRKFVNLGKVIKGTYGVVRTGAGGSTVEGIKVPNLQQKFPLGASGSTLGPNNYSTELGETGGEAGHTLSADEMKHVHGIEIGAQSGNFGTGSYNAATDVPVTGALSSPISHNNIPPFLAINFIIKYK